VGLFSSFSLTQAVCWSQPPDRRDVQGRREGSKAEVWRLPDVRRHKISLSLRLASVRPVRRIFEVAQPNEATSRAPHTHTKPPRHRLV
jgi:hypothetical protein